jgi:hypothetical protein
MLRRIKLMSRRADAQSDVGRCWCVIMRCVGYLKQSIEPHHDELLGIVWTCDAGY